MGQGQVVILLKLNNDYLINIELGWNFRIRENMLVVRLSYLLIGEKTKCIKR